MDDLRQSGVLSHLVRPEFQVALGIDGGGADPVPRLLLHGNAFAGKGTLVNACPAGEHRAVHGDGAAGADDHRVAHLHLLHGNRHLCPVPADGGGFGAQIHQGADGVAGFALGSGLQEFAQGDEGQDHGGRLKIQVVQVMLYQLHVSMPQAVGHAEQGGNAVNQRRQGAHRNQRIHIGRTVIQGFQTPEIIDPVQVDHRERQKQLQKPRHHSVFRTVIPAGNRQSHHMTHGEVHEHRKTRGGADDPGLHFLHRILLGLGRVLLLLRQEGMIAGLFHRGLNGRRHGSVRHLRLHGARQQIHIRLGYSGHRPGHFLYPGRAGRAGHARHRKCKLHWEFLLVLLSPISAGKSTAM